MLRVSDSASKLGGSSISGVVLISSAAKEGGSFGAITAIDSIGGSEGDRGLLVA